jgi:predicted nucleotidyltransferase
MFMSKNIFSAPSIALIRFLGRRFREAFYVRELAQELAIGTGAASESLHHLASYGLLSAEPKGRILLYRANMESSLLRQFKILFTVEEITPIVRDMEKDAFTILMFGTCARGWDSDKSDIDLLIITDQDEKVREKISSRQHTLSRKISPVILSPPETVLLQKRVPTFYRRVRKGILLAGEGI